MPKVPQILASGDTGGTGGMVRASAETADLSGLKDITTGINRAADAYAKSQEFLRREQEKIRREQGAVEAEMALGEVQRQVTDAELNLKRDPSVTPEDYPKKMDEAIRAIGQGVGRTIKMPEARYAFEKGNAQFSANQSDKGKREGFAMEISRLKSDTDTLIRSDVNLAATARGPDGLPSPELQLQAENRALMRVDNLLARRALTGDEANTKKAAIRAEVSEGRMLVEYQNPMLRPLVINRLAKGGYPHMPVTYQLKKAEDLTTQLTAEQRAEEAAAEKRFERSGRVFVSRVLDSWATGKTADRMTRDQVRAGMQQYEGYIPRETQTALMAMVEKPELEGGITNPDVFNAMRIEILTAPEKVNAATILREPPERLSAKDKVALIKDLEEKKDAKDISKSPFYQKGREQIMILLSGTVTGLPEMLGLPILKPAEKQKLADTLFLFDVRARSASFSNEPEKLVALGKAMAYAALGSDATSTTSPPVLGPANKPAAQAAPAQQGAPKVELPRMGDAPAPAAKPAEDKKKSKKGFAR